jgi:DNA-binding CsgD family transcriptional regulator
VAHLTVADSTLPILVARHLGDAAKLVGDGKSARTYYKQPLEVAGKVRFRPEIALIHVRRAELMLEESDDSNVLEHLGVAIPELRDMKMQPELARALSLLEHVERSAPAPATNARVPHVLTSRGTEVARLVAAGRSNREIADLLVITEGTVEVHVKHILSKLGLRSRAQVAAWGADERV